MTFFNVLWFFLIFVLIGGYFVLDGFDLGAGALYPFVAKGDEEKAVVRTSIGPVWDGNEVWLITAGGVTFAAFPKAYAVMFSALYAPLLILLFALIFRAVSFEFRNKKDCPQWRKFWDACQFLGNFLPALLLDKAEMKTVPIMIAQLRAADYSKFDLGKVYMFILLAILPVLLVYIFLSRYIVKGVTAGSVKG